MKRPWLIWALPLVMSAGRTAVAVRLSPLHWGADHTSWGWSALDALIMGLFVFACLDAFSGIHPQDRWRRLALIMGIHVGFHAVWRCSLAWMPTEAWGPWSDLGFSLGAWTWAALLKAANLSLSWWAYSAPRVGRGRLMIPIPFTVACVIGTWMLIAIQVGLLQILSFGDCNRPSSIFVILVVMAFQLAPWCLNAGLTGFMMSRFSGIEPAISRRRWKTSHATMGHPRP